MDHVSEPLNKAQRSSSDPGFLLKLAVRKVGFLDARERHKQHLPSGAAMVAFGIGAGILIALIFTRGISTLLFGISEKDPLTFIVAAILLVFVSLVACYVPARRAVRVDPMVALRYE
jgi:hypothetical protein